MSHSYGNGNSNGTSYLNKKRLEEDSQMDGRYHYDKYDKFEKYGNHPRYTNMNYMHSKLPPGNTYYNTGSRYRSNYYNNPKAFHNNGYGNKIPGKRDYKKPYQKYNTANANEGVRNLSHCEMPSPPPQAQIKQKVEDSSLKSIASTTVADSTPNQNTAGLNLKDLNKFVSNITSRIPSGRNQPYQQQNFQNNQQNINIEIHLTSSSSNLKFNKEKPIGEEELNKWKKEDKKEEELSLIKIPKPIQKFTFEPFNRNSIKIEENPLDSFELYPKNVYEINANFPKKTTPTPISESINNDNIENALSIKSSYLLAKIPNWRLVTNFVPASALTEEKFSNILGLDEEDEHGEVGKDGEKKEPECQIIIKKEVPKKSHVVYFEKYEGTVEKYLDMNKPLKKKIKTDIFNIKSIIEQYHYDILKIKNKINQNIYKTNYLTIKQESLNNAIEENTKE